MLFSYLDFDAKKLMDEGRASTEMEGAAIALLEIMEFALDEYIDIDTFTVDQFIAKTALKNYYPGSNEPGFDPTNVPMVLILLLRLMKQRVKEILLKLERFYMV